MVFPVVGGDGKPTGYEIDNSLRFNDADSPVLSRTPSSTGNRRTFTISAWVKRCKDDNVDEGIFNAMVEPYDGQNRFVFGITSAGQLNIYNRTGGTTYSLASNDVLRDPSAWYHCVCIIDTTDSTEADRQRMYVNGTRITSFADNSPVTSQNAETAVSRNDAKHAIGDKQWTSDHFDGYIAEHYYLDGVAYEPTYFAETNDNGVWVPKQYTGGNFGTNGHFLQFKQTGTSANSSGMGADTSGNDNHYTPANLAATDITVDTPTNNFATLNPLINSNGTYTLSEGNTKFVADGSNGWNTTIATMGFSKGKWYWEQKFTQITGGASFAGLVKDDVNHADDDISGQDDNEGVLYYANAGKYMFGNGGTYESDGEAFGDSFDDGDIISVAADLDNNKMYFAKNGTYQGSGNPSTGSNGLPISEGSYGLVAGSFSFVFPYAGAYYANDGCEWNFGNAPFSISSGNADANGYGNFEYAVPSGFYSLCTKNLAEYG